MALFPKIESPCPYTGDPDDVMAGGRCTLCDKVVHDLTAMTDDGRRHLVESHRGDLCVRYTVLRPALAAMALGLSGTAAMAVERPPAPHRHADGKAVKTPIRAVPPQSYIPVIMIGAPPAPPARPVTPRTEATVPTPGTVTWVEEKPATPGPNLP